MVSAPPIEVRNARFDDMARTVPRHWHGGRKAVTSFLDGLSIFFPIGERFFMNSVQAHKRFVTDPRLAADVKGFLGQEGCHSREHVRYNEMLAERGYPVAELEAKVERILSRASRRLPKRWQLAATCALEHFTALMAEMVLEDPRVMEGADPTMAALWRWHSAEENEHKAVAFDVYEKAGGFWAERSVVMVVASLIFWAKVAEHQVRFMKTDGVLFSAKEWRDLLGFMLVNPGWRVRTLAPKYLEYYKPGFHPWDLDTRESLERWKRDWATSPVYGNAA